MQMYNSFLVLFEHGLKPGGVYFLEDLGAARVGSMVDGDKKHIMVEVIKDWLEGLIMEPFEPQDPAYAYAPKFGLPPKLKSIDCAFGMCVFTKCFVDDERCRTHATDDSLVNYAGI